MSVVSKVHKNYEKENKKQKNNNTMQKHKLKLGKYDIKERKDIKKSIVINML